MITKDDLLAAGFTAHRWHDPLTNNLIYCKPIRRDGILLYQLDARTFFYGRTNLDMRDHTSVSARFYLPDCPVSGRGGIDFEPLLEPDATIEQVEALFARVYEQLGCCPDLHNN